MLASCTHLTSRPSWTCSFLARPCSLTNVYTLGAVRYHGTPAAYIWHRHLSFPLLQQYLPLHPPNPRYILVTRSSNQSTPASGHYAYAVDQLLPIPPDHTSYLHPRTCATHHVQIDRDPLSTACTFLEQSVSKAQHEGHRERRRSYSLRTCICSWTGVPA